MVTMRQARFALALLAASCLPAWAQTSPPQGVLRLPSHTPAKPAPPAKPPKADPLAPVQRVAPMADRSALGHSVPGRKTPVVHAAKTAPRKPPAKPARVVRKPAPPAAKPAVAAAAAGAVAGAAAPAAAKPAPPPAAKPAEEKPPPDPTKGTVTGLPLPRWAALRSDDVNLRKGPGTRYPIEWVYRRRDLPVEIEREFEVWRLVVDQDGVKGWVHTATLTGRRSFAVHGADATLRSAPRDDAGAVALLKLGVVGRINACAATAQWCNVSAGGYRGWLKRSRMWGIFPGEAVGG